MNPKTLEERVSEMRLDCKNIEKRTRAILESDFFQNEQAYSGQHGEMKAQAMLAVRHFEDARMRLGKVLQYAGDGVSCFDK